MSGKLFNDGITIFNNNSLTPAEISALFLKSFNIHFCFSFDENRQPFSPFGMVFGGFIC